MWCISDKYEHWQHPNDILSLYRLSVFSRLSSHALVLLTWFCLCALNSVLPVRHSLWTAVQERTPTLWLFQRSRGVEGCGVLRILWRRSSHAFTPRTLSTWRDQLTDRQIGIDLSHYNEFAFEAGDIVGPLSYSLDSQLQLTNCVFISLGPSSMKHNFL